MISHAQNIEYLEFANRVLNVKFEPKECAWITNLDDAGNPLAVTIYNRFSPHNCEMSIATNGSRKWASKKYIGICYRYPFIQMGVARISVVIEEKNSKSLMLCRKLGHVEEARLKSWFGDQDGILMRMTREECKWL